MKKDFFDRVTTLCIIPLLILFLLPAFLINVIYSAGAGAWRVVRGDPDFWR